MPRFAAAIAIPIMQWIATPIMAAERVVPTRAAAPTGKAVSADLRRDAVPLSQNALPRHARHDHGIDQVRSNLGCSGIWCGRQFVLMLGVGY